MIRSMGVNAAFRDQNRLNEMLQASFDRGVSRGKACIKNGNDYEKLYKDMQEKFSKALRALSILGILNYWEMEDVVKDAEEKAKANRENENIANRVRRLRYAADHMKGAVAGYEAAIAPLFEEKSADSSCTLFTP